MKQSKRLLASLLALLLALGLGLPALAVDEPPEEPDPAMPVITVQPYGAREGHLILSFRVEAYIPNGDEPGFLWVGPGTDAYSEIRQNMYVFAVPGANDYYVEVYNRSSPEYRVVSDTASVDYPFFEWVIDWLAEELDHFGQDLWAKIQNALTPVILMPLMLMFGLGFGLFVLSLPAVAVYFLVRWVKGQLA